MIPRGVNFISDSRARKFVRKPRVALVVALSHHPSRARLFVADAVATVDTSHRRRRAAFSIYAIQRCAMPFTGENMKTPLCVSRRCSLAFRVYLFSPLNPSPFPPTRFYSDICLSYVFALRISSRAFPGEGLPDPIRIVSFNPSSPIPARDARVCVHSSQLSARKMGVN